MSENHSPSHIKDLSWGKSLVGRDWEIYWNDEEEDEKTDMEIDTTPGANSNSACSDNAAGPGSQSLVEATTTTSLIPKCEEKSPKNPYASPSYTPSTEPKSTTSISSPREQLNETEMDLLSEAGDKQTTNTEDIEDADSSSEGSIISDWYAGKVLSVEPNETGGLMFEVSFVGDTEVYNMELDPSKVRASARGWIKRTKAIFASPPCDDDDWVSTLPPDTSTEDDQSHFREDRASIESEIRIADLDIPEPPSDNAIRSEITHREDLKLVLRLRHVVRSQIYLRRRLATIINHHGSSATVDGEPNPTESYVDFLTHCLEQLEHLCSWYCRCWKLLESVFVDQAMPELAPFEFQQFIEYYLENGRAAIIDLANVDIDNTKATVGQKRAATSPSGSTSSRRIKRRKTASRWGDTAGGGSLIDIIDDEDLRSARVVVNFVNTLVEYSLGFCCAVFGRMLTTLAIHIVEPVVMWRRTTTQLLNEKSATENSHPDELDGDESADDSSDTSTQKTRNRMFTIEEVESSILARRERLLSVFNFSSETERLEKKFLEAQTLIAKAADMFKKLAVGFGNNVADDLLLGFKEITGAMESPNGSLVNIEPLGAACSRDDVYAAIEIRRWLVSVNHARQVREREVFVLDLLERDGALPILWGKELCDSVSVKKLMKESSGFLQQLVANMATHKGVVEEVSSLLAQDSSSVLSIETLRDCLQKLSICPAINIIEEKAAICYDIIDWQSQAAKEFDQPQICLDFSTLEALNANLQLILTGQSKTRRELVNLLEDQGNQMKEKVIRFAERAATRLCGDLVTKVSTDFLKADQWKRKSEAMITALKMHGNSITGHNGQAQKLPAMVDLRRVNDLLSDYTTLVVKLDAQESLLRSVNEAAEEWADSLRRKLLTQAPSLDQALVIVLQGQQERPAGIIMDPTRHVLDSAADLLHWQKNLKSNMCDLFAPGTSKNRSQTSEYFTSHLYGHLCEGLDVLEEYVGSSKFRFVPNAQNIIETLASRYGVQRSAKALSREKLNGHPWGASLLKRVIVQDGNASEGFPLLFLLWLSWHVTIAAFVAEYAEIDVTVDSVQHPRCLSDAKMLHSDMPSPTELEPDDQRKVALLLPEDTEELALFNQLIHDAETLEQKIQSLLAKSKTLLRGTLQQATAIYSHVAELKDCQVSLRDRFNGKRAFSLDMALDPQLDLNFRVFSWLSRTFPYTFLYMDEATYSSTIIQESSRIPWDLLINLHDKIPYDAQERGGNFALISMRIRELYKAAKTWQEEVSKNTMLSNRGAKRRAPSSFVNGSPQKEQDAETNGKVQMERMKQLADHPILSKIKMPREGAVNGIVEKSTQFEDQLHAFLAQDYGGPSPDRSSYPESKSLVGQRGEFVLYRLSGSGLFEAMTSSLSKLSVEAEQVFAETPGKAAFDWIKKSMSWIDMLVEAVTNESHVSRGHHRSLVIPATDATRLLEEGERTFLQLPDDLKKTLSQHGIFVSTNKQDQTLKVSLKKDGAHHSVGATVIRWLPILFECLRADVKMLNKWDDDMKRLFANFNLFYQSTAPDVANSDVNLYEWFCYKKKFSRLLHEGVDSLVISPPKHVFTVFMNVLTSIENRLKSNARPGMEQQFARKWQSQSANVLEERFTLLDSLLYRKQIQPMDLDPEPGPTKRQQKTFRDACRAYLADSLRKALRKVGLHREKQHSTNSDPDTLCNMRSWEIEKEMFHKFQELVGVSSVTEEYRNKARSLRASLENKENVILCLQIVSGVISASKLVGMTTDQLSGQKTKKERALARKKALASSLLTTGKPTPKTASAQKKTASATPSVAKETTMTTAPTDGVPVRAASPSVVKQTTSTKATSLQKADDKNLHSSGNNTQNDEAALLLRQNLTRSESRPPPPPPSLARSTQQNDGAIDDDNMPSRDRGTRIYNSINGDKFLIEIGQPRVAFHAAFFLEDDAHSGINGHLPDSFSEKGRLKIDEFSRFLTDKLQSGRWCAICLRLTMNSGIDAKEYKKFYKEYEVKKRIAMFSIDQNSKLFLVTPRFHGAAKSVSLPNKKSTYAIVLTKELGLLMD